MITAMFVATVVFLTIVTVAGLMAWFGDIRNEIRARQVFPEIADQVRPSYVVTDDLDDPFFDYSDQPTDEIPAEQRGSHPMGICPPMLVDHGLAQVMVAHLRKRVNC